MYCKSKKCRVLGLSENLVSKIGADPSVQCLVGFWHDFPLAQRISPLEVHPANWNGADLAESWWWPAAMRRGTIGGGERSGT